MHFSDQERSTLIKAYLIEYESPATKRRQWQNIGRLENKERGVYAGRKPIEVSLLLLDEVGQNLKKVALHSKRLLR